MLKSTNISNYSYTGTLACRMAWSPFSRSGDEVVGYILSTTDYDPFGMPLNGRDWNPGEYRFGFNGQEKDQEIYNNQSTTTATFWEYDGRIGRRWNLDPKPQIFISDYAVMGNNPIMNIDVKGDLRDDFKLNSKTGEITKIRETNDKTDKLYAQSEDGGIDTKKSITVQKGILDKKLELPGNTVMITKNNNDLKNLFKFAATNSNVEWSFSTYKNNKGQSFSSLNTIHNPGSVMSTRRAFLSVYNNLTVTYSIHSHPGKYTLSDNKRVACPSGFNLNDLKPEGSTDGDRPAYESDKKEFQNRIPKYYDIFIPDKPSINVLYNDKDAFIFE